MPSSSLKKFLNSPLSTSVILTCQREPLVKSIPSLKPIVSTLKMLTNTITVDVIRIPLLCFSKKFIGVHGHYLSLIKILNIVRVTNIAENMLVITPKPTVNAKPFTKLEVKK